MQIEETLVVVRKWQDTGDLLALFPANPSDLLGYFCESYAHLDGHGAADFRGVIRATTPVSDDEAGPLIEELTKIGYRLQAIKRASRKVHDARWAEARRIRLQHK